MLVWLKAENAFIYCCIGRATIKGWGLYEGTRCSFLMPSQYCKIQSLLKFLLLAIFGIIHHAKVLYWVSQYCTKYNIYWYFYLVLVFWLYIIQKKNCVPKNFLDMFCLFSDLQYWLSSFLLAKRGCKGFLCQSKNWWAKEPVYWWNSIEY